MFIYIFVYIAGDADGEDPAPHCHPLRHLPELQDYPGPVRGLPVLIR